jgi:hypothetical protein
LAGNATNAAIAKHNLDLAKYRAVVNGISDIKAAAKAQAGSVIREELSQQPGGLEHMTLDNILIFLEEHYGQPSAEDIEALYTIIARPFDVNQPFRNELAVMTKTYRRLAELGELVSEHQKMKQFMHATAGSPLVAKAVENYCINVPEHSRRTFTALTTYVSTQLTNAPTAGSHGYAAATTAHSPVVQVPVDTAAIVALVLAQLADQKASAANVTAVPRNREAARGKTGRGGRGGHQAPTDVSKYCFVHGFCGHPGIDCSRMVANPQYTVPMRIATGPCEINGLLGSIKNAPAK